MEPPATVQTALSDRPVEDAVCLEAGAGVGNGTAGLLAGGASQVYAITNERDHAESVRERLRDGTGREDRDRLSLLEADLRSIPLADNSVDIVLAHALFGVIPPAALPEIAAELTRVAADGAHLVVDDYEPIPADSPVRRLFGIENAAAEIASGRSALYFYPESALTRLFAGYGWSQDRSETLLDPVPWTADLLDAHLDEIHSYGDAVPDTLATALVAEAERLVSEIESAEIGTMYSLAMKYPLRSN